MSEVRYRGTKVVTVSPDYADNVKFADDWLPAQAGTDAALAMAMGHVILKENFVDRKTEYFDSYVKRNTDLAMLVTLVEHPDGHGLTAGKFVTEADLGEGASAGNGDDAARFKTVMWDTATASPVVPNGSMGFRYGDQAGRRWNLELGDVEPALSMMETEDSYGVEVALPCFEDPCGAGSIIHRGVPARQINGQLVTTVFDLMLAQYGVGRLSLIHISEPRD